MFQVSEFHLLQFHSAAWHIVSMKMSFELVPCDGVDVYVGVGLRLPPIGCCPKELVYGKKNLLVIHPLGDHKLLLNSLKTIYGFHWVLSL
jgi:hypothetical protein